MPFTFEKQIIQDLIEISPKIFEDDRGHFFESYKKSEFDENGINVTFVQDNRSYSSKGVLRGLHYQLPPFAQGKLVQCLSGEIFDVAVDIRKSSDTFGKWLGVNLSGEKKNMFYIPPGFAHGFYTISEQAEVMYKVTAEYNQQSERGIIWNDPDLSIDWKGDKILLSDKDQKIPQLKNAEIFS